MGRWADKRVSERHISAMAERERVRERERGEADITTAGVYCASRLALLDGLILYIEYRVYIYIYIHTYIHTYNILSSIGLIHIHRYCTHTYSYVCMYIYIYIYVDRYI